MNREIVKHFIDKIEKAQPTDKDNYTDSRKVSIKTSYTLVLKALKAVDREQKEEQLKQAVLNKILLNSRVFVAFGMVLNDIVWKISHAQIKKDLLPICVQSYSYQENSDQQMQFVKRGGEERVRSVQEFTRAVDYQSIQRDERALDYSVYLGCCF